MKPRNANRRGRNPVAPSSTGPKVENPARGSKREHRAAEALRRQVGTPEASSKLTRENLETLYCTCPEVPEEECPVHAREKQLRDALSFYAESNNWRGKDHYSTPNQDFPAWKWPSAAEEDQGKRAREALT